MELRSKTDVHVHVRTYMYVISGLVHDQTPSALGHAADRPYTASMTSTAVCK